MSSRIAVFSLSLLAIVLLGSLAADAAVVRAQTSVAPAAPRQSVVNEVPDFYAEGESNGYTLKISPKGGTLSTSGSSLTLMPWGYVTAKWSIGTVYIIFLANVTPTDFWIDFLYLTNSSSQFALRTFEYQSGTINSMTFDGAENVNSRMVPTTPIAMPNISLQVKPRTDNTLSAIGPELYVNHNSGTIVNGTNMLKITAVQNQIFQGPSDYNELWTLLTDDFGNYYFAILYMQNSDPNHVILEHQVRLNDYQTFPGRTFNAQWVGGPFPNYLKVRLPKSNLVVKVNGFPFQTDSMGQASIYVPQGSITVEVPSEIAPAAGVRLHFASWDGYGNANPLKLSIDSYAELKANYQSEYQLTLESDYGGAKGAGWYVQGSNATFSVPSVIDSNNGTRRVFQQFKGDYNSTSNTGLLIMNTPKHVSTIWKTQFNVKLQTVGVPANSTVALTIGGKPQFVSGSNTSELWANSGEQLTIQVQTNQIQGADANYNFKELRVNGQGSSSTVVVTSPISIAVVFSEEQKAPSTIDLKVTPASTVAGYPVALTGSVSGSDGPSNVTLSYSADKMNWQPLASVPTGRGGSFSYTWTPDGSGTYFVEASWPGDAQHTPASGMASVQVQNAIPTNVLGADALQKLIRDFTSRISAVPFVAFPLELATSLLVLGAISADLLVPSAPAVIGYLIGSLLVGFVFVFPISAVALSVKAVRSHKSPSIVWLTPLATIWSAALTMLMMSGVLFSAPQALLAALVILLISSNTFLIPLAFSLLLARTLAG